MPPKLVVRWTGIPRLACPKAPECGLVEASRPVGLVEGNRYDTSVAAEIMVAKYACHVPVHRQQDLFASCGWTPARSSLLNVLESAAHLIRPVVAHLREVVRAGPIVGTDDTTVTLVVKDTPPPLDPDDPKAARAREVIAAAQAELRGSITARMWVYRSITAPINVFDFTVSRHRDGPELFVDGFAAGYRAADLMTLVSSAARNDLDVFMDVKDVLDRLLAGESNDDVLRPDVWRQSHPEAIRIYRQEERRSRADAKAVRRARRRIVPTG